MANERPNSDLINARQPTKLEVQTAQVFQFGGGLFEAFGILRNAREAQNAAKFNAGIAREQAKLARANGFDQANRYRIQTRQLIGHQKLAFAGGNIVVGHGTAGEIERETAEIGETDARQIINNAHLEAWGFEVQASNFETKADNAKKNARLNAFGSVLEGFNAANDFGVEVKK